MLGTFGTTFGTTMDWKNGIRLQALTLLAMTLAACGGGSPDSSVPQNRAPSANAGIDQSVDEFASVMLDGSGSSDPDGDPLTYSWSQTGGSSVDIINADSVTASFDAPDVLASETPVVLTFRLTVSDGTATGTASVDVTINDVGLGANSPPVADAGGNQTVAELTTVTLDGSGSADADGDTLSYAWAQTGGPPVALAGAAGATATFEAPDVSPGTTVTLNFELTVDDGTDSATDSASIVVSEILAQVNISGRLFYERPAIRRTSTSCSYNFDVPETRPVRRAPVELRDAVGVLLATTTTDDTGAYGFIGVDANTEVTIRVRSQIVQQGRQSWEVYVRDNTSSGQPLPNRPVYVIEFGPFDSGSNHVSDRDFVAPTGWGGVRYNDIRAAAPLAILDTLLDGYLLVAAADTDFDMGRLDAFWSPLNSVTGTNDIDNGRLVTAFYTDDPEPDGTRNPSLFLPGDAIGLYAGSVVDTDEFDRSVILHEWGHFFEDELARSDSIGGAHSIPGWIEPRVAFGEGWGYGIAAIAGVSAGDVREASLCDIAAPTGTSVPFNVETPLDFLRGTPGFFNEVSIASLLFDLYDAPNEGANDNGELGFGPIYATMTDAQAGTPAFTTLFSFATELGATLNQADLDFLHLLLNRENVDTDVLDIWGSGQVTLPDGWRDVLPVYVDLPTDGSVLRVCVNNDLDPLQDGNKPGEWRYLRFTTNSTSRWRVFAEADPVPPSAPPSDPVGALDVSDPDLWMYFQGDLINICPGVSCLDTGSGVSGDPNSETMDTALLDAGTYVIAFNEYIYGEANIASNFPEQMCFNITANPR